MIKIAGKYLLIIFVMLGTFFADFQTKKLAEKNLRNKPTVTAIQGFLDLGYTQNKGMIFGILNGKMHEYAKIVLIAFRILILVGLTLFIGVNRNQSILILIPFTLFWAGALGNLVDQFLYGYVVDFIHIKCGSRISWPFFFNLADAYITVGFILFLLFGTGIKGDAMFRSWKISK